MEDISRESLLKQSCLEKIALIYSRADLNCYFLEVLDNMTANYIHQNDELRVFKTSNHAVEFASNLGANTAYICLDNTYDECSSVGSTRCFSYLKV